MAKKIQRTRRTIAASRGRRRVDVLTDEIVPSWKKSFVYVRKTEIATWKGALVLMFVAGIIAALIWSAKTGYYESSEAAPASTLYFNPASTTTTVGSDFTLTAMINPSTNQVSAAELHVTFDPTKFSLNSITAPSAPSSCNATPAFSTVLQGASINNTSGTASIILGVCMANPAAPVVTTTTVATFSFHALATASASSIAFTTGSQASAVGEAADVITTRTPASVTVNPADATAPSGGSIAYTNGYATTASVSFTAADGTDAGSGINTSSRIVQRRSATLSGGSCGTYGSWGAITPTGTYPNFTDTTVASGNCYQYQYLVSDNASPANQATYTSTNAIRIDTAAPAGGSMTYANTYITNTTVSLTAADGTDAASGINTSSRIVQRHSATLSGGTCGTYGSWGTVTPTGTYPNFTDATVATGNCYQYRYQVSDAAGSQATYTGSSTAMIDAAAPAGGSVSYTDGYITSASVFLTAADGSDAVSGVNTASRVYQRRSATLSGGTCGTYGSWGAITPTGTYPSLTDSTATTGNCYQYRYLVSDTAGSQATYTGSGTIRIDTSAPSGGSATIADGYAHSVSLTAADGTDSISGINTSSRVVQRHSATLSGGTCGTYGSWSAITPTGTYPNFTDATVATGNCYQYRYLVSDTAGSQTTYTATNTAKITYGADITLDGTVNLFDYNILFQNFGATNCGNTADIIGNCVVDLFDYNQMFNDFGKSI